MNALLLSALLSALLQASVLIAGAWLLISLSQRHLSAARLSTACRLAMAAAFLTFGGSVLLPFLTTLPVRPPAAATVIPLPSHWPTIDDAATIFPAPGESVASPSPAPLPEEKNPARTEVSAPALFRPDKSHALLFAAFWLAGACMILVRWSVSLIGRQALFRTSADAANAPWLAAHRSIRGWNRIRHVRTIPRAISPCVWGIRKPVLLLPAQAETWPTEKLHTVLTHECAHLLRRDPLWQFIRRGFAAILWFHPPAWSLVRKSRRSDEQAADDAVLQSQPDAPSYASLLVECARNFTLPAPLRAATHTMALPETLTQRVEAVLNPETDRRPVTFPILLLWALVLSALTVASSLASPEVSPFPPVTPEEPNSPAVAGTAATSKAHPSTEKTETPAPSPLPQTGTPSTPQLPKPAAAPGPKITGDSILFPPEDSSESRIYLIKGTARFEDTELLIEADEISLTLNKPAESENSGAADASKDLFPGNAINPATLAFGIARGSVRFTGKLDGVPATASADMIRFEKDSPTETLVLTGWPRLMTRNKLIKGNHAESRISFGPKGMKFENCTLTSNPPGETPKASNETNNEKGTNPDTTQISPDKNPTPNPFDWKIVPIKGLDYISFADVKAFYKFRSFQWSENKQSVLTAFTLRSPTMSIKGSADSREILINGVKFIQRHPITAMERSAYISRWDLSTLLDPIIRPKHNKLNTPVTTVIIDPGHGGNDSGATSDHGTEAAYTLDTAQRLKPLLENLGLTVLLTRSDDSRIPLNDRVSIAATRENALLISLHFGHDPQNEADQGIRTFFPTMEEVHDGNAEFLQNSTQLAVAVHANTLFKLRGVDGGIRTTDFATLRRQTKTPAILMECGTLSNPEAAAKIATEAYRQNLAEAIAGGVKNYLKATGRQTGN